MSMTLPTALDAIPARETDGGTQALLSELARVKALFQGRAVAAVMGIPGPTTLVPVRPDPSLYSPEAQAEIEEAARDKIINKETDRG